ncbi:MAG TPA: class I SAM-dependent methyltransferase [Gaiellaceae bacterium]|nr:class I SAM-dependent methyltransferase [Gaiellaceae bacterium]
MQSFESFVRERLPDPPARVLEVGCGRGELTTALAVAGHDALGIDPIAPDGPLFRRLTLDDLENDARYDAVVAAFSLHHIRDLDAALRKIASLLVPAGLLLVDEFAWDRLDEPTLAWLWGQRRAAAAAAGEAGPASPAEVRADWEAEHVGLHGHDALRRCLDEHFEQVAFVPTPHLHRLLGGVSSAVLEQSLVDAGTIAAIGFRYAGRPRRAPGRTA